MTDEALPATPSSIPSAPSANDVDFTAVTTLTSDHNNSMYSTIPDTGGEIQCEFFHPPPYVPENEFESPPSYNEVLQETQRGIPQSPTSAGGSQMNNSRLVAAQ